LSSHKHLYSLHHCANICARRSLLFERERSGGSLSADCRVPSVVRVRIVKVVALRADGWFRWQSQSVRVSRRGRFVARAEKLKISVRNSSGKTLEKKASAFPRPENAGGQGALQLNLFSPT